MKVREVHIYDAVQYNKRGDHPNEYVCSMAVPIIGELPGIENRWPKTGRLGTLDECKAEDLQYSVLDTKDVGRKDFSLNLGWWILELDGKVVGVMSPEDFAKNMEAV